MPALIPTCSDPEFDLSGQPLANVPPTLQLGLGSTDAKLIDPGFLTQPANTPLLLVPKWTASVSVSYETPVSSTVDLFIAADYSYACPARVPVLGDTSAAFVVRPPINLVDANFGFKSGSAYNSSSASEVVRGGYSRHSRPGFREIRKVVCPKRAKQS